MAEEPDYLICIECECPAYTFEWLGSKLIEATCESCGNEDLESFATPEDYEEMIEAG